MQKNGSTFSCPWIIKLSVNCTYKVPPGVNAIGLVFNQNNAAKGGEIRC